MAIDVCIKKKLKGFTLDISFCSNGKSLGILGASGSGKSMTLRCIAGIQKPDQGRIVINDRVLYDSDKRINLPPQQRKIGYLFQNYALFPNMTVRQNIKIGMDYSNGEKERRLKELISRFQLEGLEERYPVELSGGQQQRVALARILAYEPDIIMMDEPFSALNSVLKEQLQQELLDLLQQYEKDVLIVSHSRDEIYRFSEELVIMDNGKRLLSGYTKHLFKNPIKREVAKLTGCKNLAKIEKLDENKVMAKDWNIVLTTDKNIHKEHSYIGIRAHDIEIVNNRRDENLFEVEVEAVIEMPFEMHYYVTNRIGVKNKRIQIRKAKGLNPSYEIGDKIYIILPKDKVLLLSDDYSPV